MSAPHALRDYVIGLYRRGHLATLEEGALIAGVSRRRVLAWLDGLDWRLERNRFIAKQRRRAVEVSEGKITLRPTKAMLHRIADKAKRKWDEDRAAKLEK